MPYRNARSGSLAQLDVGFPVRPTVKPVVSRWPSHAAQRVAEPMPGSRKRIVLGRLEVTRLAQGVS